MFVKNLLSSNGIMDKPIWVTEFSLRSGIDEKTGIDLKKAERRMEKAFEHGADKIFIIPPFPYELPKEQKDMLRVIIEKYN